MGNHFQYAFENKRYHVELPFKNKFGQKYLKLHWMAGLTVLTAMAL